MASRKTFYALRGLLDELGYHDLLPVDAIPLVRRLASDLKELKTKLQGKSDEISSLKKFIEEQNNAEDAISLYQIKNGELKVEIHEIRMKRMEIKEKYDTLKFEQNEHERNLRTQLFDAVFLAESQKTIIDKLKATRVKTAGVHQQSEVHPVMSRKILENCHNALKIRKVAPEIPMQSSARPPKRAINSPIPTEMDTSSARVVGITEDRINTKESVEQAKVAIHHLQLKVELRNNEIRKMREQLREGTPPDALMYQEYKKQQTIKINSLNLQISQLLNANDTLRYNLQSMEAAQDMPTFPGNVQCVLSNRKCSYRADAKPSMASDHEKEDNIDQLKMEKAELKKKVDQLINNERVLMGEIEALTNDKSSNRPSTNSADPSLVAMLEKQRDHYKDEVKSLRVIIDNRSFKNPSPLKTKKIDLKTKVSGKKSNQPLHQVQSNDNDFEKLLREECDYYKKKYIEVLEKNQQLVTTKQVQTADKQVFAIDHELQIVKNENKHLTESIQKINTMLQLQSSFSENEHQRIVRENLELAFSQLQVKYEEVQMENTDLKENIALSLEKETALQHKVADLEQQLMQSSQHTDLQLSHAEDFRRFDGHHYSIHYSKLKEILDGKQSELEEAKQKIYSYQCKIDKMINKASVQDCENDKLRSTIVDLKISVQQFRDADDHHRQLKSSLENKLYLQEMEISDSKMTVKALEEEIKKLKKEVQAKNEKLKAQQNFVEKNNKDKEELLEAKATLAIENARLLQESTSLMKNNYCLIKDLEKVTSEKEFYLTRGKEYLVEVERFHNFLIDEKRQIDEGYDVIMESLTQMVNSSNTDQLRRVLSRELSSHQLQRAVERDGLERESSSNQNLENFTLNAESQTSPRLMDNKEQCSEAFLLVRREINQFLSSQQSSLSLLQTLRTTITSLEEELIKAHTQQLAASEEFNFATTFGRQLQSSYMELETAISKKDSEIIKMKGDVEVLNYTNQRLKNRIKEEQDKAQRLEGLINEMRKESMEYDNTIESMQYEITFLKQRISMDAIKIEQALRKIAAFEEQRATELSKSSSHRSSSHKKR